MSVSHSSSVILPSTTVTVPLVPPHSHNRVSSPDEIVHTGEISD